MDAQVQLVFRGEVLSGFDMEDVKRSLGRLLHLDETRAGHLFTGTKMVLKRSLPAHDAQRYVDRLAQIGARVHVEPLAPAAAPVATAPALAPALAPASSTAPAASGTPSAAVPLALAPLEPAEEQITCPSCGERQSKRILCRSCATNMPMGIAARLEEEEKAREARKAEFRSRHGLKSGASQADDEVDEASPMIFGFGFDGRLARLPYATANTWLMTAVFMLTLNVIQRPSIGRVLFFGFGMLMVTVFSWRLAVLRCHDCGRHGWWSLFMLLPYVGFVTGLLLTFVPGTAGTNEFGRVPRRGTWKWLGIAVVLSVLSLVVASRSALQAYHEAAGQQAEQDDENGQGEAGQGPDMSAVFPSFDAANAFRDEYLPARGHKAFAVSAGKSWGFKVGASSEQEALRGAMSDCDARRPAYTAPCRPINLNGKWVRVREQ